MSTVAQIMDALAAQILSELNGTVPVITNLQVDGRWVDDLTPPCIDVYPSSDEFVVPMGFGIGNKAYNFTVRARVSTADHDAGQDLLLSMMDPQAATSIEQAILSDTSLGGVASLKNVDGPTGYGRFPDSPGILGCTWNVLVIP